MRKLTARHLLSRVRHFTDRMATAYDEEDIQTKMEQMDRVMKEIDQFDRSIGPGLGLGRFVSWPQGDGKAFYFVTGIGKDLVRLAWLPWWDCWQSSAVVDGQALRSAVERAIRAKDGCRTVFGRQTVKLANPPNEN
jgi:hypothetical protein